MNFLSFVGGAATGISENIDKYEREAAKMAELQVNLMSKNFMERKAELDTLTNKSLDDAKFVAGLYSNEMDDPLFQDRVFAATQDPATMKLLRENVNQSWFDPKKITLASIAKPLQDAPSGVDANTRIRDMFSVQQAVKNVQDINLTAQQEGSKNPFRELGAGNADAKAKTALAGVAKALGTTPEQMAGAMQYSKPVAPTTAKFDYSGIRAPMDWNTTKSVALASLGSAQLALADINKNPNATQVEKDKAQEAVNVSQLAVKNIKSVEDVLSSDQVKYANQLAAAKSVLVSPNATAEQKKEAQSIVNKARTMDQTAAQALQEQIAGLVLTVANSKDPEKVKMANEQLNKIYTAENKKVQGTGAVTFDQFRKLINDRIKNDLDSKFTGIGNVQFSIDGTASFKGDPQLMKQFNDIKINAVKSVAATYADENNRMLNPVYAAIVDTYQIPKDGQGRYNFNIAKPNENNNAGNADGRISVTDPTGKTHYFPNQEAADKFKAAINKR